MSLLTYIVVFLSVDFILFVLITSTYNQVKAVN
nr:MAG TPA: hypothetical protein [Caudoviricetes sp.]